MFKIMCFMIGIVLLSSYTWATDVTHSDCHIKIINPANGNTDVPIDTAISIYYSSNNPHACSHLTLHTAHTHILVPTDICNNREWSIPKMRLIAGRLRLCLHNSRLLQKNTHYVIKNGTHTVSSFTTNAVSIDKHHFTIHHLLHHKNNTVSHAPAR